MTGLEELNDDELYALSVKVLTEFVNRLTSMVQLKHIISENLTTAEEQLAAKTKEYDQLCKDLNYLIGSS